MGTERLRTKVNKMNNKRFIDHSSNAEEEETRLEKATELFARLPFDHDSRVKITIRYEDETKTNVIIVVQGAPKEMFGANLPERFIRQA